MMQVFDEMTAPSVNGTFLVGKLENYSYDALVDTLGEPTFNEPSGDGKTQVEWVVKFDDQIFTIYDWKTFDRDFTLNQLDVWHVGGKGKATVFIQALERKLLRSEQAEIL